MNSKYVLYGGDTEGNIHKFYPLENGSYEL